MFSIKKVGFLALILSLVAGCRSFSEIPGKSGIEFDVEVATESFDKEKILRQAISQIEKKLSDYKIDGKVTAIDGKPNQLSVRIYGGTQQNPDEINRLKNVLFTSHQMELKKAVSMPSPRSLETYFAEQEATAVARGAQEVLPFKDATGASKFVIVEKSPVIVNGDLRDAAAIENGQYFSVAFRLNPEGAKKLGDWTGKNIGNYLAIVLDKKVVSAPYIRSQITDSGQIDGRFSKAEAEEIAASLKSGDLPLEFKVTDEKPFGK